MPESGMPVINNIMPGGGSAVDHSGALAGALMQSSVGRGEIEAGDMMLAQLLGQQKHHGEGGMGQMGGLVGGLLLGALFGGGLFGRGHHGGYGGGHGGHGPGCGCGCNGKNLELKELSDIRHEQAKDFGSVNLNVCKSAGETNLQVRDAIGILSNKIYDGFTATALASCNTNSHIQASEMRLAAQLADCCCKTQQAIHADGEATRALVTKNLIEQLKESNQNLRDDIRTRDIQGLELANRAKLDYLIANTVPLNPPNPVPYP